jgi:hypothetical protein
MVGAVPPVAPVGMTNMRRPEAGFTAMYDAEKENVPTYRTPLELQFQMKDVARSTRRIRRRSKFSPKSCTNVAPVDEWRGNG